MATITICEWCDLGTTNLTTAVVKGFEKYTHVVCADCVTVTATQLVECATCDNFANYMEDTFFFTPRYFGKCNDCSE